MARRLEIGEAGEIVVTPQLRDVAGKWKVAPSARSAERWRARVYYRSADGIRRSVDGFGRRQNDARRGCEARLAEALIASDADLRPSMPLEQAGSIWLERMSSPGNGKSSRTLENYTTTFEKVIMAPKSELRGLTLSQANDTQKLYRFLKSVAEARGNGSSQRAKIVLSGVIGYAIKHGVLQHNATRNVGVVRADAPYVSKRDHGRSMTRQERDGVVALAFARVHEPGLNPRSVKKREATADLMAFLARTGARISEARHLLWTDLDLDASKAVIRGTKTISSHRTLSLPLGLAELLSARRDRLQADEGFDFHSDRFVFAAPGVPSNSVEWEASNCASSVRQVLDAAGLEWAVPHTFRRTVASLLDAGGTPIARIADQLGHADPAMTMSVYLGRDPGGDKSELAALL